MRAAKFGLLLTALLIAAAPAATAQTSNVTLNVATFGGHAGDVEKAYVGDRMTRTTGVKIEWTHGNPSDFLAKMLASRGRQAPFDVVLLDDAVQDAAIKAGVLAKLDPALVPNLNKIYPRARNPQGYGPYAILYSIGIVYNKDKLKAAGIAEPTSWQDLWNPKLAGHISIPDISLPQGADFVMKMAQLNGGSEADVIPGLQKIAADQGRFVLHLVRYAGRAARLRRRLGLGLDQRPRLGDDQSGFPDRLRDPEGRQHSGNRHRRHGRRHGASQGSAGVHQHADRSARPTRLGDRDGVRTEQRDAARACSTPIRSSHRMMPSSEADLSKLYSPNWGLYNANLAKATDYWNRNVKH